MKQKTTLLTLLALLLSGLAAWAQPTLTAAVHLPQAGDTLVRTFMTVPSFTPGPPGPGQTFLFSGASSNGQIETGIFSLENGVAPWSYNMRLDFGNRSAGYVEFYHATADSLADAGFDRYLPDVTPFERHNPAIKFPLPFGYGASFRDHYSGRHANTLGWIPFAGTVDVAADAWGDMILGADTIPNVLRIHSIDTLRETLWGTPILLVVECYDYYAATTQFPVLSACTDPMGGAGYDFYSTMRNMATAVVAPAAGPLVKAYPNPFQGQLRLEVSEESVLEMVDLQGRVVANRNLTVGANVLDFQELPSGAYVAVVRGVNGVWEGMVVRE